MRISTVLLLLASSCTWAEISSLTSEELTDTYIKDTTVIVRQPKEEEAQNPAIPVKLKVTPLEQATQVLPQDQTHSVSSISNELSTYDDLNNFRALDNDIQTPLPTSTTEFLKAPTSLALLQQIQTQYGLEDLPTDLSTLGFNTALANGELIQSRLPELGSGFSADEQSMTFTIPNLGNFNSQQIQSPNGEIGVNVTPTQIQYTINIPK